MTDDILVKQLELSLLKSAAHKAASEADREAPETQVFSAAYHILIRKQRDGSYSEFQRRLMHNDTNLLDRLREYVRELVGVEVCGWCNGSELTEGTGELGVTCDRCGRKTLPFNRGME